LESLWRRSAFDHYDRLARLPGPHVDLCRYVLARMTREWDIRPRTAPWSQFPTTELVKVSLLDNRRFGFHPDPLPLPEPAGWSLLGDLGPRSASPAEEIRRIKVPQRDPRQLPEFKLNEKDAFDTARWVPADAWMLRFGAPALARKFAGAIEHLSSSVTIPLGFEPALADARTLLAGAWLLPFDELAPGCLGEPTLIGLGPDPTVGADLALIVPMLDVGAVRKVMSKHPGRLWSSDGGARRYRHESADASRALFSMELDNARFVALAWSPAPLRRIAELLDKPEASLVADGSYRIRPFVAPDQGQFFASTACLDRLTAPRTILNGLRRSACRRELRTITHEQYLHRMLNGELADTPAELVGAAPHVCPSGGSYSFALDRAPECSVHGTLDRPLTADDETGLMSAREQRALERLAAAWPDWFRGGAAPIVGRIRFSPRLRIDIDRIPAADRAGWITAITALGGAKPSLIPMRKFASDLAGSTAAISLGSALRRWPDTSALAAAWGLEGLGLPGSLPGVEAVAGKPVIVDLSDGLDPADPDPVQLPAALKWAIRVPAGDAEKAAAALAKFKTDAGMTEGAAATVPTPGTVRVTGLGKRAVQATIVGDTMVVTPDGVAPPPGPVPAAPDAETDPTGVIDAHLWMRLRLDPAGPMETWRRARSPKMSAWACVGRSAAIDLASRAGGFDVQTALGWARRLYPASVMCPDGPAPVGEEVGPCRCPIHGGLNMFREPPAAPPAPAGEATEWQFGVRFYDNGVGFTLMHAGAWPDPSKPSAAVSSVSADKYMGEARIYAQQGRFGSMVEELRNVLFLFPGSTEAIEARSAIRRVRERDAVTELADIRRRISEQRLDVDQVRESLTTLAKRHDGTDSAIEAREILRDLESRSAPATLSLAVEAAGAGDYAQALLLLDKLRVRRPDDPAGGAPADRLEKVWRNAWARSELENLTARVESQDLAPAEVLPSVARFRETYTGTPADVDAAALQRRLLNRTAGDLLGRAMTRAAEWRFDRALGIAGKVILLHPGSSEADDARRLIPYWELRRLELKLADLRADHRSGRIEFDDYRIRLDGVKETASDPELKAAAGERLADAMRQEAARRLAEAKLMRETGKTDPAIVAAGRLAGEFPDTPAGMEALTLRFDWWKADAEPQLASARAAAAAARWDDCLATLDRLADKALFPEALEVVQQSRRALLGDEGAIAAYRGLLKLQSAPETSPEVLRTALDRFLRDHPKAPQVKDAGKLLSGLNKREEDRLLQRAVAAVEAGDHRSAGETIVALRDKFPSSAAAGKTDALVDRMFEAELKALAGHLSADRTREVFQRLAEVDKNPALPPERLRAVREAVARLGEIRTLQANVNEKGPAAVRAKLEAFVASTKIDVFRETALDWAKRWKYTLKTP